MKEQEEGDVGVEHEEEYGERKKEKLNYERKMEEREGKKEEQED